MDFSDNCLQSLLVISVIPLGKMKTNFFIWQFMLSDFRYPVNHCAFIALKSTRPNFISQQKSLYVIFCDDSKRTLFSPLVALHSSVDHFCHKVYLEKMFK